MCCVMSNQIYLKASWSSRFVPNGHVIDHNNVGFVYVLFWQVASWSCSGYLSHKYKIEPGPVSAYYLMLHKDNM